MSTKTEIEYPDEREIRREYSPVVERARSLEVSDEPSHRLALEGLKDLKRAEKKIRERLDPIIESAHKAHKGLTKLRGDLLLPIETAFRVLDGRAKDYEEVERRKAEAKARELQEAARIAEEERQLADAIAFEEAGDKKTADEILAEKPVVPEVYVAPNVAEVAGVGSQERWHAEVTDLISLVKYVAINPSLVHLLEPSMPSLNAMARSQRTALLLPGVKAVKDSSRTIRA